MRALRFASTFALLFACGSPTRATVPCPAASVEPGASTSDAGAPDAHASDAAAAPPPMRDASTSGTSRGKQTWETLNAAVARYHVFAPQAEVNLGVRFADEIATLEAKFAAATTAAELGPLVDQYVGALHNPHCWWNPARRPQRITLGVTLEVVWDRGTPSWIVTSSRRPDVQPGDVLLEAEGTDARDFLRALSLRSRSNHPRGVAYDLAQWLTDRELPRVATKAGDTSTWRLGRGGTEQRATLTWAATSSARSDFDDFSADYAHASCASLPARDYGPYELTAAGFGFCLYTSRSPRFRDFPIVRQHSFRYLDPGEADPFWRVTGDQRTLTTVLSPLHPRGVILDLRGNGGGHNPNWFIDWWAPRGWTDRFIQVRLVDDLADATRRKELGLDPDGPALSWLEGQLARRAPGQALSAPRPFFCRPDAFGGGGCAWDNRYEPLHRVTTAPVALLVDHGCMSSCDSVALTFDENDFAPLVGEPTAAGYTSSRVNIALGDDLGFVRLALTRETSGKDHHDIEAVPLHIDYPIERTASTLPKLDRLHVDAAIRAFAEYKYLAKPAAAR